MAKPSVRRQALSLMQFVWRHPANSQHRARSLTRALSYQFTARVMGREGVGTVGDRGRVRVQLHDNGASQSIYANPSDYWEMTLWRQILRPSDLFLDVGANVGLYSLWAADADAQVWAFEPDPGAAAQLRENATLSGLEVTVHEFALGAERGVIAFSVGLGTGNRVIADGVDALVREVDVRPLDEVLKGRRARGMKIDVEGAERLVLQGARTLLETRAIDAIQLEWNFMSSVTLGEGRQPVLDLLESAGYVLVRPSAHGTHPVPRAELLEFGADVFALIPPLAEDLIT
jgi:FkbM family methyltransferase